MGQVARSAPPCAGAGFFLKMKGLTLVFLLLLLGACANNPAPPTPVPTSAAGGLVTRAALGTAQFASTPAQSLPTATAPATIPAPATSGLASTAAAPPVAVQPSPLPAATNAPVQPTPTLANSDAPSSTDSQVTLEEYAVPPGSHPHDVAPASDGGIWYTAQSSGELGYLDPQTGKTRHIALGSGSAPHGVIVGPDGAPWITDGGLNAIVRVDPATSLVEVYPLPDSHPRANLNTAAFDKNGVLWFTGQRGVYGRLDPKVGRVEAWDAPRGAGPYGIIGTSNGDIYYASLAGSHIARIDTQTGQATPIDPPTRGQGARRIWSDSRGRLWVSEWNAGQVGVYDPQSNAWREWKLPGSEPHAYAVYVDETDNVWLSDFGANALVRFNPQTEQFDVFPLPSRSASIRQLLGRAGEVWGAESGVDKIIVARVR